jgi:hypothetical protein
MDGREAQVLDRIAADVRLIRERLPVLEDRVARNERIAQDLETRIRALEASVGRLVAIAALAGGLSGPLLGALFRWLGK